MGDLKFTNLPTMDRKRKLISIHVFKFPYLHNAGLKPGRNAVQFFVKRASFGSIVLLCLSALASLRPYFKEQNTGLNKVIDIKYT